MIKKLAITALIAASSFTASAKTLIINGTPIVIGKIIVNGVGCPSGSVEATANSDNTQVTILFNQYNAVTNATNTVAISDCNIAIPISVSSGKSVGIVEIDWRGQVLTHEDTFATFHREFFFSGERGPTNDTTWQDSGVKYFNLSDDPDFTHYSSCDGKPMIARADTAVSVVGANSYFSVRSADVSSKLLFKVDIKDC